MALVSLSDFDILERLRREKAAGDFVCMAGQAARAAGDPEPTEEEIVESVKPTREEQYGERYQTMEDDELPQSNERRVSLGRPS